MDTPPQTPQTGHEVVKVNFLAGCGHSCKFFVFGVGEGGGSG